MKMHIILERSGVYFPRKSVHWKGDSVNKATLEQVQDSKTIKKHENMIMKILV